MHTQILKTLDNSGKAGSRLDLGGTVCQLLAQVISSSCTRCLLWAEDSRIDWQGALPIIQRVLSLATRLPFVKRFSELLFPSLFFLFYIISVKPASTIFQLKLSINLYSIHF